MKTAQKSIDQSTYRDGNNLNKLLDIDYQHFKAQVGFSPTMQECFHIKESINMFYSN